MALTSFVRIFTSLPTLTNLLSRTPQFTKARLYDGEIVYAELAALAHFLAYLKNKVGTTQPDFCGRDLARGLGEQPRNTQKTAFFFTIPPHTCLYCEAAEFPLCREGELTPQVRTTDIVPTFHGSVGLPMLCKSWICA